MNINSETDLSADLQIGPTSLGMVRFFLAANNMEVPMDFTPDEAAEIADEIKSAAKRAREVITKLKFIIFFLELSLFKNFFFVYGLDVAVLVVLCKNYILVALSS